MTRVGLHLTDRCQLDCDHCLRDPGQAPLDLPFDVLTTVLREAAHELGVRRVSLTGGEPTLYPRFAEVLDLAAELGMSWDMVSNGRRFDRLARWLDERPERRTGCRKVTLSMDGATDETHDAIRGEGQRREVLAAMAVLVSLEIPFDVAVTLHARNLHELEAVAIESHALGASQVRFGLTQATGTPLDGALRLSPANCAQAYERVLALRERLDFPVLLTAGWPERPSDRKTCDAIAGETLNVDVHGRLTLCCQHSGVPSPDDDRTVLGSAQDGLAVHLEALAQLRLETERVLRADHGRWPELACNSCLAHFGRPHWTTTGISGTLASRDRWRGLAGRSALRVIQNDPR